MLSPHVTFIVQDPNPTGLQGTIGRTRILEPHEIGTSAHAQEVAISVRSMLEVSGISKESAHLVLIKCPLLTSEKVEIIKSASKIQSLPIHMNLWPRAGMLLPLGSLWPQGNLKKVTSMRQCGTKLTRVTLQAAALEPS